MNIAWHIIEYLASYPIEYHSNYQNYQKSKKKKQEKALTSDVTQVQTYLRINSKDWSDSWSEVETQRQEWRKKKKRKRLALYNMYYTVLTIFFPHPRLGVELLITINDNQWYIWQE